MLKIHCKTFNILFLFQPRVLQPSRSDPEVRPRHVPPVLQGVQQGHRLQEVGLKTSQDIHQDFFIQQHQTKCSNICNPYLFVEE